MNTRKLRSTLIGSLGVALALASGSALAISFRLTDLGTLGGTSSRGVAINASGQVTGISATADGDRHAFLWDGTTMQDLGTLGGADSHGACHQRLGAGDGRRPPRPRATHAFLWDGTTMQDLGTLGGTNSVGRCHQRLGAGDGRLRRPAMAGLSRLPVGRHDDAGPRHAGGRVIVVALPSTPRGR